MNASGSTTTEHDNGNEDVDDNLESVYIFFLKTLQEVQFLSLEASKENNECAVVLKLALLISPLSVH